MVNKSNSRVILLIAIVAILLFFNYMNYISPAKAPIDKLPQSTQNVLIEPGVLVINGVYNPNIADRNVQRDVFMEKIYIEKKTKKVKGNVIPAKKQMIKNNPSAAELAMKSAIKELEGFELVGIAIKGGKKIAFLVKNKQAYPAEVGDKVIDNISVESISTSSVMLRNDLLDISHEVILGNE